MSPADIFLREEFTLKEMTHRVIGGPSAVGDVDADVERMDIYFFKDSLRALIAAWLDISNIHFRDGVRLNQSARK